MVDFLKCYLSLLLFGESIPHKMNQQTHGYNRITITDRFFKI